MESTTAAAALGQIRAALDRLDRASAQHRRNGLEPQWVAPRDLALLAWRERDEAVTDEWLNAEEALIHLIRTHTPVIADPNDGFCADNPKHAITIGDRLLMLTTVPRSTYRPGCELDLFILDMGAVAGSLALS